MREEGAARAPSRDGPLTWDEVRLCRAAIGLLGYVGLNAVANGQRLEAEIQQAIALLGELDSGTLSGRAQDLHEAVQVRVDLGSFFYPGADVEPAQRLRECLLVFDDPGATEQIGTVAVVYGFGIEP